MNAALPHGYGKEFHLFALALVVSASGWAHAVDSALVGNWFTDTEIATSDGKAEKRGIVSRITGAGELTMCVAST